MFTNPIFQDDAGPSIDALAVDPLDFLPPLPPLQEEVQESPTPISNDQTRDKLRKREARNYDDDHRAKRLKTQQEREDGLAVPSQDDRAQFASFIEKILELKPKEDPDQLLGLLKPLLKHPGMITGHVVKCLVKNDDEEKQQHQLQKRGTSSDDDNSALSLRPPSPNSSNSNNSNNNDNRVQAEMNQDMEAIRDMIQSLGGGGSSSPQQDAEDAATATATITDDSDIGVGGEVTEPLLLPPEENRERELLRRERAVEAREQRLLQKKEQVKAVVRKSQILKEENRRLRERVQYLEYKDTQRIQEILRQRDELKRKWSEKVQEFQNEKRQLQEQVRIEREKRQAVKEKGREVAKLAENLTARNKKMVQLCEDKDQKIRQLTKCKDKLAVYSMTLEEFEKATEGMQFDEDCA